MTRRGGLDGYEHVANIERMHGAWLLVIHEIWAGSVYDEGGERCLVTGAYEAWSSVAACKRSLRDMFGPLRYDGDGELVYVYARLTEQVDR